MSADEMKIARDALTQISQMSGPTTAWHARKTARLALDRISECAKSNVLELCSDAIVYVLARAQRDPNLGYYLGPGCEAFVRLCAAEAALSGRSREDVERERGKALWGDRQSERDHLRQRIAELERGSDTTEEPACEP